MFMAPDTRLLGRSAGRALEMGCRHRIEYGVVADPGHILDPARFQARQRLALREAGVKAHYDALGQTPPAASDRAQDEARAPRAWTPVPRAQAATNQITGPAP